MRCFSKKYCVIYQKIEELSKLIIYQIYKKQKKYQIIQYGIVLDIHWIKKIQQMII